MTESTKQHIMALVSGISAMVAAVMIWLQLNASLAAPVLVI